MLFGLFRGFQLVPYLQDLGHPPSNVISLACVMDPPILHNPFCTTPFELIWGVHRRGGVSSTLIGYHKECWSWFILTAGRWSWKSTPAKERVTTHLTNGLAPKMDGAQAGDRCPRGKYRDPCRRSNLSTGLEAGGLSLTWVEGLLVACATLVATHVGRLLYWLPTCPL